jgi:broad specificity phosphatase PhoE
VSPGARKLFVRHGESVANAEGWLAGYVDAALTARGEGQAESLVPHLTAWKPQRVVASTLQRAWRTAALGHPLPHPPVERVAALRERNVGAWERVPRPRLKAEGHMATLVSWADRPPEGESQRDLARRVLGWLAAHDDDRDTLYVLHGGVIRVVVGLLDGADIDTIGTLQVANCERIERTVAAGRWAELLEALP